MKSIKLTKYRLGEVASFEVSNIDKKSKEGEKVVRLCNFTDVYTNWAITDSMKNKFMEATASDSQIEKFSLKKGQVAITKDSETRDDIGIPSYIADDFKDIVLGYHCALITPDSTKVNGKYLNAFLNSNVAKKYFENNAVGSGMRFSLTLDTINDILLYLPSLKDQKEISNLFSLIDKKISLNQEINRNLEALARQLYDYWFVQFDFPDENGRPYKTSGGKMVWNEKLKREIPGEWRVCKLKDFIEKENTGDWGYDEISEDRIQIKCIRGADIGKLNDLPNRYIKKTNISKLLKPYDIVIEISGGSPIQATGRSAYITPGLLGRNGNKITCSNFCQAFSLKKIENSAFFYFLWNQLYYNNIMFNYEGKTSGIKNFMTNTFLANNWFYPPESLQSSFFKKIAKLFELKDSNILEINLLQLQRNELLPLLMNGQVSVNPREINCDLSLD